MRESGQTSVQIKTGVISVPIDLNTAPTMHIDFGQLISAEEEPIFYTPRSSSDTVDEPNVEISRETIRPPKQRYIVTIGDMHGNALFFIARLAQIGILKNITDAQYKNLKETYEQHDDLIQYSIGKGAFKEFDQHNCEVRGKEPTADESKKAEEDLKKNVEKFQEILGEFFKKENINNHVNLRLLGDLLADRGAQDYFILLILESLKKANVNFEIIYSNHDNEFMLRFQKNFCKKLQTLGYRLSLSMENLYVLIEKNIVKVSTIQTLVNENYIPILKLLSYDLLIKDENSHIVIYSHAPVDLFFIRDAAKYFGTTYQQYDPAENLAKTIDEINNQFQLQIIKKTFNCAVNLNRFKITDFFIWGRPDCAATILKRQFEEEAPPWLLQHWRGMRPFKINGIDYTAQYGPRYDLLIAHISDRYSFEYIHGHIAEHEIKKTSVLQKSQEKSKYYHNLDSNITKRGITQAKLLYFLSQPRTECENALFISQNNVISAFESLKKITQNRENWKQKIDDDITNTKELTKLALKKNKTTEEITQCDRNIAAYLASAKKWNEMTDDNIFQIKKENRYIGLKIAACMIVLAVTAICVVFPFSAPIFGMFVIFSALVGGYGLFHSFKIKNPASAINAHAQSKEMRAFVQTTFSRDDKKNSSMTGTDGYLPNDRHLSNLSIAPSPPKNIS